MSTTTATAAASKGGGDEAYDALVLGAGWSGIITALRLAEASQKVLLLEARDRVGGRAFTHTYDSSSKGKGDRTVLGKKWDDEGVEAVDFGCSWIHGYYEGNPVKGICEKLNIPVSIPTPKKASIIGPSGPIPNDLFHRITSNLIAAMSSAQTLALSSPTTPPSATTSLASFLLASDSPLFEGLSQDERSLAEGYARQMHIPLGTTLEHVALRWVGWEQNFNGTDAAPQGGFTRVIDTLVTDFVQKGGKVITGEEVRKVQSLSPTDNVGGVKVVTSSGEYSAPVAICTFPLAVLKAQEEKLFEPALSQKKRETIRRTNVGDLNKVMLVYDSVWWDQAVGTFTVLPSGAISGAGGDLASLLSQTTLMVGADSDHSRLLVMFGAGAGRELESFSRPEVAEALHQYLCQRIPVTKSAEQSPARPSHNFMTRWSKHALTGGATSTPVVVGEENSPLDFVELSRPEYSSHLLFAGEHTELHHRGSVAGAVVSAEREATRALALLEKLKKTSNGGRKDASSSTAAATAAADEGVERTKEVRSDEAAAKI